MKNALYSHQIHNEIVFNAMYTTNIVTKDGINGSRKKEFSDLIMLLINQAKFLNELLERMPEIEIINFLRITIRHRKILVYYKRIMLNVQKFEILIRFVSVSIKSTLGISRHIPNNMDNRANSIYVQSV